MEPGSAFDKSDAARWMVVAQAEENEIHALMGLLRVRDELGVDAETFAQNAVGALLEHNREYRDELFLLRVDWEKEMQSGRPGGMPSAPPP